MSNKRGLIYRANLVKPMVPDPMRHVVEEIAYGLGHIRSLAKKGLDATSYKEVFFKEILNLIGDEEV